MYHTTYFFCPNSFICRCSLLQVFGLVQGFWLLTHHQCWTITETPLRHPVITQSLGDPAAFVLKDQFLHELHQLIGRVDVGVNWFKVPDLSLDGSWIGQLGDCVPRAKSFIFIFRCIEVGLGLGADWGTWVQCAQKIEEGVIFLVQELEVVSILIANSSGPLQE